jgi:hypothetical protein
MVVNKIGPGTSEGSGVMRDWSTAPDNIDVKLTPRATAV